MASIQSQEATHGKLFVGELLMEIGSDYFGFHDPEACKYCKVDGLGMWKYCKRS